MPEKIALLKDGLDNESMKNVDLYLERILYLPDGHLKHFYKLSKSYLDSLYTEEERSFKEEYEKCLLEYKAMLNIKGIPWDDDFYLFHHGLRFAPNKVKEYIRDKDYIDGGAFSGNGVVVLTKYYNSKRSYAFELSPKNCKLFQITMDLNEMPKDRYELIPMGLSNKSEEVYFVDTGTAGTTIFGNDGEKVKRMLTDIDSFVKNHNINPGFIKTDLEGYGLQGLEGMAETIRTFRPVLSLAVYHSPIEFFEMKPLLDQIVRDKNYKITIKQFNTSVGDMNEIALFAYPAELDEGEK